MTPDELKKVLDNDEDVFLLDVREQNEYDYCHLEGSQLIPMSEFATKIHLIPKNQLVVVYCHYGVRSQIIVNFLLAKGYKNVHNLDGGIDEYSVQIDKSIARY